ncbi:MAG: serine hydrolase [Maribacter sp.]
MKIRYFILFGLFFAILRGQEDSHASRPFPNGPGIQKSSLTEIHLDSVSITTKMDSMVTNGIRNRAFPGAQVLIAKDATIIFHKAYGFHTYDSLQPVALDDIYDLASVTKILGPLPALMKLVDEGKIALDTPFSTYWKPWKRRRDKKDLTLREILAHQAGLKPYIVFLNRTLKKNGRFKKRFLRTSQSRRFQNKASEGLFVKNRMYRKMYRIINRSEVSDDKTYRYSGLAFLIFPEVISQITGKPYETYMQDSFYKPLGMESFGFLPRRKGFTNGIVPTEVDTLFRHGLTQGWVHDENAALLGGVSGNAGLFGTAEDVARMMQMFVDGGVFNGQRYISEKTIAEFTRVQYPENENRRGLGFDKPYLNNSQFSLADAYPAPEVSPQSFGHSGFTGTFVWADPVNGLVYIFLSNRVYPTRENRNLYTLNIRPAIQQVWYKALDDSKKRRP